MLKLEVNSKSVHAYAGCFQQGCVYALINSYTHFAFGIPCGFCLTCGYRTKLREQYKMEEKPCNDCCVHFFCHSCALCQEYRELENRGFNVAIGTYIRCSLPPIQLLRFTVSVHLLIHPIRSTDMCYTHVIIFKKY